jgi:hypothetical protein
LLRLPRGVVRVWLAMCDDGIIVPARVAGRWWTRGECVGNTQTKGDGDKSPKHHQQQKAPRAERGVPIHSLNTKMLRLRTGRNDETPPGAVIISGYADAVPVTRIVPSRFRPTLDGLDMPAADHLVSTNMLGVILQLGLTARPQTIPAPKWYKATGLIKNLCRLTDRAVREYALARRRLLDDLR